MGLAGHPGAGVYVRKVMSWDDSWERGRPARTMMASWERGRPARTKPGTGLGHLPHLNQPGMVPWLSFGLADAVPADRVAACSIALKLSGGQGDRMRAGRPRSPAMPSRRWGGGCLAGHFSESRRAPHAVNEAPTINPRYQKQVVHPGAGPVGFPLQGLLSFGVVPRINLEFQCRSQPPFPSVSETIAFLAA